MEKIDIVDAIEVVRSELRRAVENPKEDKVQFPVSGVQLEFQVGITSGRSGGVKAGAYVIELSADKAYEKQSLQKVVLTLGPPVNERGEPLIVTRLTEEKP